MANNKAALDKGFKKAKELIFGHLYDQSAAFSDKLISHAIDSYRSVIGPFTGNTITSYACGLYVDGVLTDIRASSRSMKSSVHIKIKAGESLFLDNPYSGKPRRIAGMAEIVLGDDGLESSINFLSNHYTPKIQKGIEIVMCTGTEYSVYQENVWKANFLTNTYLEAKKDKLNSFKPLP